MKDGDLAQDALYLKKRVSSGPEPQDPSSFNCNYVNCVIRTSFKFTKGHNAVGLSSWFLMVFLLLSDILVVLFLFSNTHSNLDDLYMLGS